MVGCEHVLAGVPQGHSVLLTNPVMKHRVKTVKSKLNELHVL